MTGSVPKQLVFDIVPRPAYGEEDFLVSKANETALAMVERWPDWPHWALVIVGPPRSGKSHLANVWKLRANAVTVAADALSADLVDKLRANGALVIEDLHKGISDEALLFHLLNVAREHKLSILITSETAPGDLTVRVPDLRSRLRAVPVASIEPPDDALLKALLVKHFADRQLAVEPHVIDQLAMRTDRSFAAIADVVAAIDERALAAKRPVTRVLAREVLAEQQQTDDTEASS